YLAAVNSFFIRSIHLERKALKIVLTCVIINITLNFFCIPLWGAIGAACTTVITETILAVLLIILNFQELQARCSKETVNILENTLDHVR
ncbi:MAG: polysaccharide biosynthesis C-terminal domain-containing protein, partial [Thermodesulfobacteriota bacterium]